MSFPSDLGARQAPIALRQLLRHYLVEAEAAAKRLRDGSAPEVTEGDGSHEATPARPDATSLHAFRVAIKRIRILALTAQHLPAQHLPTPDGQPAIPELAEARKALRKLYRRTSGVRHWEMRAHWIGKLSAAYSLPLPPTSLVAHLDTSASFEIHLPGAVFAEATKDSERLTERTSQEGEKAAKKLSKKKRKKEGKRGKREEGRRPGRKQAKTTTEQLPPQRYADPGTFCPPLNSDAFRKVAAPLKKAVRTIALPPMATAESFASVVGRHLQQELAPLAMETRAFAAEAFADQVQQEALHLLRLRIKRIRYLLEPLLTGPYGVAPLVDDCRYLQSWLGDGRDLRILGRELMLAQAKGKTRLLLDRYAEAAAEEAERKLSQALNYLPTPPENDAEEALEEEGTQAVEPAHVLGTFQSNLNRIADRLSGAEDDVEIERKFLLRAVPPEVHAHPHWTLDQGYLPGREIRERLRRIVDGDNVRYRRTIKAGRGVKRIEFEEPLDAALFDQLWPLTEGARLQKRRYRVPAGDLVWEIDEFLDRDLVLAEVELDSLTDTPTIPDWLAPYIIRDVTEESGFVNQKLAH